MIDVGVVETGVGELGEAPQLLPGQLIGGLAVAVVANSAAISAIAYFILFPLYFGLVSLL
jgi:riboflavin transporter FmnP